MVVMLARTLRYKATQMRAKQPELSDKFTAIFNALQCDDPKQVKIGGLMLHMDAPPAKKDVRRAQENLLFIEHKLSELQFRFSEGLDLIATTHDQNTQDIVRDGVVVTADTYSALSKHIDKAHSIVKSGSKAKTVEHLLTVDFSRHWLDNSLLLKLLDLGVGVPSVRMLSNLSVTVLSFDEELVCHTMAPVKGKTNAFAVPGYPTFANTSFTGFPEGGKPLKLSLVTTSEKKTPVGLLAFDAGGKLFSLTVAIGGKDARVTHCNAGGIFDYFMTAAGFDWLKFRKRYVSSEGIESRYAILTEQDWVEQLSIKATREFYDKLMRRRKAQVSLPEKTLKIYDQNDVLVEDIANKRVALQTPG